MRNEQSNAGMSKLVLLLVVLAGCSSPKPKTPADYGQPAPDDEVSDEEQQARRAPGRGENRGRSDDDRTLSVIKGAAKGMQDGLNKQGCTNDYACPGPKRFCLIDSAGHGACFRRP